MTGGVPRGADAQDGRSGDAHDGPFDGRSDDAPRADELVGELMYDEFTDDELAELAMAADPEAPLDPDAVPLRLGDAGAALLPEWYMPSTLCADAFGRRGRVVVVGGIVTALLLVNGLGLCVTYGFPEIAW